MLALAACTGELKSLTGNDLDDDTNPDYVPQQTTPYTAERADDAADDVVDANDSDHYWENSTFGKQITVRYNDASATVSALDGAIVTIDGAHVAIDLATNSVEGVEIVASGTSSDGSLKIYSGKKYKLLLNGLDLTSTRGAALNNQSAKRTFIVVNGDNYLTDAATLSQDVYYPEGASASTEDEKGCLFSESHLIFSGTGVLCLIGNRKHALAVDDSFYMRPGVTFVVTCCASDAIHANDGVTVAGGMLNILNAGTDGIECDEGGIVVSGGKVNINSSDDAIAASFEGDDSSIVPDINITGGTVTITTTAEKGMGLKAEGNVNISGGEIDISVSGIASKCIKSTLNTTVSGGTLLLNTSGSAKYYTDDADTSSASCIKTGGNLTVADTAVITAISSGAGGKGFSTDGAIFFDGGQTTITTTGGQYSYSGANAAPGGGGWPGGGGGGWPGDNTNSAYTSSSKGIRAEGNITFNGGTVSVKTSQTASTSDGSGCEGIESKNTITFNGSDVEVEAYDDAVNAAKSIVIAAGRVYAYSYYNDGIDSNGTLTVSGGLAIASGTKAPEEGFDCDQNTFKITGGIIIGSGGATSSPTTSVCTQRTIVASSVAMTEGRILNIKDSSGNTILNYTMPRTLSGATMLISTPDIVSGGKYTFTTGGSVASQTELWHGCYTGGTYSGGSTISVSTSIK